MFRTTLFVILGDETHKHIVKNVFFLNTCTKSILVSELIIKTKCIFRAPLPFSSLLSFVK